MKFLFMFVNDKIKILTLTKDKSDYINKVGKY